MMSAIPQVGLPGSTVHRRFGAILLLSFALHAGVLASVLWQKKASPLVLPPIFATLRLMTPTESGPAVAPAAQPASLAPAIPQKVRQYPSRSEPVSPRSVIATAGPANQPAPVLSAASSTAPVVAASEVVSTAASAAPSAPAPAAPHVVAARPESELLDGYRRRLGELFARQQEYPRIAALRGWEGEVRLRLKVARKGQLLDIHLDRSSGFSVLDEHALAMVEALSGLPPLPEALEANEIQVVVPINYKLKKTT